MCPMETLVLPFVLHVLGPMHEKRNIERNKTARIDLKDVVFIMSLLSGRCIISTKKNYFYFKFF